MDKGGIPLCGAMTTIPDNRKDVSLFHGGVLCDSVTIKEEVAEHFGGGGGGGVVFSGRKAISGAPWIRTHIRWKTSPAQVQ